jgi:predicted enzyme related to lactoylglutathione lyase
MRTALIAMIVPLTLLLGQAKSDAKKPLPPAVGSGRISWFDITTTDLPKCREFYGKLFDWKFTTLAQTDQALEIVAGDVPIGTLRSADGAVSAFNGVVYVQVPDIQEAYKKAKDLGATVVPGFPFDLPDGRGAIGIFADPSGHPMGMYSRTAIAKAKPVK